MTTSLSTLDGAPRKPDRKPRLELPAAACDTHFHVIGPPQAFPYMPDRRMEPNAAPKETIFALHRHLGIERGVAVQSGSTYGTDLRALVDLLRAAEGRYRGIAVIEEPVTDASLKELHTLGVRGIRYFNLEHLRDLPSLDQRKRLGRQIASLGWHIVFLGDIRKGGVVEEFLSLGVPLVLDHMARRSWKVDDPAGIDQADFKLLRHVMENQNVWVKVSCADRITKKGAPFADVAPYARALIEAAPDRVLWGTDYPHNHHKNVPDDADLVDFLSAIAPEPALMKKLMVDNPARLYGW
jgi:2-pyrone-4,6-dicarboxylate lactonase